MKPVDDMTEPLWAGEDLQEAWRRWEASDRHDFICRAHMAYCHGVAARSEVD